MIFGVIFILDYTLCFWPNFDRNTVDYDFWPNSTPNTKTMVFELIFILILCTLILP